MSTTVYPTVEGLDDTCDVFKSLITHYGPNARSQAIGEGFVAAVSANSTGKLQAATASYDVFGPIYQYKQVVETAIATGAADAATDAANIAADQAAADALVAALP